MFDFAAYSGQAREPSRGFVFTLRFLCWVPSAMGVQEPQVKKPKTDESVAAAAVVKAAAAATKASGGPQAMDASAAWGAGDDEKFDPNQHAGMLGISTRQPDTPSEPTEFEIVSGEAAMSLKQYIVLLQKSVEWRLAKFLFENKTIRLRRPLHQLRTPVFTHGSKIGQKWEPTAFWEGWDMKNCLTSLITNQLYQSSLTMFAFDFSQELYEDINLGFDSISWTQYCACKTLWSDERLTSSSTSADHVRFIFEGFVPAAVKSVDIVKDMAKNDSFFMGLAACGANAQLWYLMGALDTALKEYDALLVENSAATTKSIHKILRLFEAALNIQCRVRLAPTELQIKLDQLAHKDIIRVMAIAVGAISFTEFALEVLAIPSVNGKESGVELVSKMETFGTTFRGKPIERNMAFAVLGIVGIADKDAGLSSLRFLERVDANVLADPTKILRVFQTLRKICSPNEWEEGAAMVLEGIGIAILTKESEGEKFTGDYLVPKARRSVGFVQGVVTAMKFKKWFLDDQVTQAAGGACSGLSVPGLIAIKKMFASPRTFWRLFASSEEVEEQPDLIRSTEKKFEVFKESMACAGDKEAAVLIFKVMTNQFLEEMKELATREAKFADTFNVCQADVDDAPDDSLLKALHTFRSSLIAAPIQITKSNVDFDNVYDNAADSEHVGKVYKKVVHMRKALINFTAVDFSKSPWARNGQAAQVLQRSQFMKSKGVPGKENSLFLCCADLYPNREAFQKADAPKHPVILSDGLKEAAKWCVTSKLENSICLFTDGRNGKVRRAFETVINDNVNDESKHFDGEIIYTVPQKGDPRFSKRLTFASLSVREGLVGVLPVSKVRMHSKARNHYAACGEKTTQSATYSKVPFRPWGNLPKLGLVDKEKIAGVSMPTYPEEIFESLKGGHPLFMLEVKEVEWYLALFEDLSITHVFDVAAGSGAAAMAAAVRKIPYEGLGMNADHVNWLDRILDKAMFAVVVDSKDEESMKIRSDVNQYFNTNIAEARKLLEGAGDVQGFEDDEDEEEEENPEDIAD